MRSRWGFVSLALCAQLAVAATDVNHATEAQLDGINGIGPALSGRILQARHTGPFSDWADLSRRVPGIGTKKAAQLSANGLTVNGQLFDAAKAPQTPSPSKPP